MYRLIKRIRPFVSLCGVLCAGLANSAEVTRDLRVELGRLTVLSVPYGSMPVSVRNQHFQIIRAYLPHEAAWGGDGYSILVQNDKQWDFVRFSEGGARGITVWSVPHTEEDVITEVVFLKPLESSLEGNLSILVAHRNYQTSWGEETFVQFSLYQIKRMELAEGYYFQKVSERLSKKKYLSAEKAIHEELGL